MDLIEKINTLLNATLQAKLSPRERRTALDQLEQEQLAAIRQALGEVEAREQGMAERLKDEQAMAAEAAQRSDPAEQIAHQRRAAELEHYLNKESLQAINLEEKLAALEQKLALAKEAVEKEAQKAARRDEEAGKVLAQGSTAPQTLATAPAAPKTIVKPEFVDDDAALAARKSRLSD
jgi:hypothetical protein